MKKTIRFRFFQIVAEKGVARGLPMLDMEESEINILWALCKKGPKSIYALKEKMKFELQLSWPKRVWIQLPDILTASEAKEMVKNLMKPKSYQRTSIHKVVNKLSVKNLVEITRDTSGARIRTIVKPTFQGLVLYLQNPFEKARLDSIFEHYSEMIPFSDKWDSMENQLGREKCMKALEQTVQDFVDILQAKFQTRHLNLVFEGFLESPPMLMRGIPEDVVITRERDNDAAKYLESKEALALRNSYIAYLAVHDIRILFGASREETEELLPGLESENELAYFEKRQVGVNPLFKGNRLKEFFPKYASIEWFFTGMFVKNLLWHKKAIEKQKNKIYDFEVEYI